MKGVDVISAKVTACAAPEGWSEFLVLLSFAIIQYVPWSKHVLFSMAHTLW
jgi:hypothetical protein